MLSSAINEILREYEALRNNAEQELENRQEQIYKSIPLIREIDQKISSLSLEISKAILANSSNAEELIESLRQKTIDLKMEKGELLASNNYSTDYLTIKYKCNPCKDTGFIDGQKCSCLKQKLIDNAYKQSNLSNLLAQENFETFNFDYYSNKSNSTKDISPKENMQSVYKACLDFVGNFDNSEENLLFTGAPGLGKTFLSSCIAKELLDKGKTVFYQTAFKILDVLEDYKFSKNKSSFNGDIFELLFNVDLLIIDDLGSEFVNSYTSTELFNVLNSRLLEKKKTIISTNLNMDELYKTYSGRVTSRIFGNYKVLEFFGDDIRQKNSINL